MTSNQIHPYFQHHCDSPPQTDLKFRIFFLNKISCFFKFDENLLISFVFTKLTDILFKILMAQYFIAFCGGYAFYYLLFNVARGWLKNPTAGWPAVPFCPVSFYSSKQWQLSGTRQNHQLTSSWALKSPLNIAISSTYLCNGSSCVFQSLLDTRMCSFLLYCDTQRPPLEHNDAISGYTR